MLDLRAHFARFLAADPARLHVAAHSHHPWPDVTRAAQIEAWDMAARLQDGKWGEVLGPVLSDLRTKVARQLALPDPTTLVFAPNTHDFLLRILSALPTGRPPRILTIDAEFHSLTRQLARLEEDGLVAVTRIPAAPHATCLDRLVAAAQTGFDLIWVSEVFFASGFALEGLEALADAAGDAALVIDGYHGFMARPVDLSRLGARAFYLSGGYKYAMGGEGCCFLHCPPGWLPRPRATGWYAAYGALSGPQGEVGYATDGWRFMGATFDPSGLYRLRASLGWFEDQGLTTAMVRDHAHALQARFVEGLGGTGLDAAALVVPLSEPRRGNFLTFELPDAEAWQTRLEQARIVTDRRATRLRFGFGIYHTTAEVDALLARLRSLAPGAGPPRPAPGLPREARQGTDGAMHATKPLALTMGEPAGIGPEITLAAWRALRATGPAFFLIGDPALLPGAPIARIAAPEEAAAIFPDALPVLPLSLAAQARPGQLDAANAPAVIAAIEQAVGFAKAGRAGGVVTNPIQKSVLTAAGFPHPGHTEFLGALAGMGAPPVMMLACPGLRVVPVTIHMSLKRAAAELTTEAIVTQARIVAAALARDFGIASPRLAIAGLNPHAGEDGTMGREDIEIVAPAVAALREAGIEARGPLPADTLFTPRARAGYDCAICMYHDQALIPVKTVDMDGGVNVTLGLSIVRTSPDHGTALDIAGQGIADPGSLIAALRMAGEMAAMRAKGRPA